MLPSYQALGALGSYSPLGEVSTASLTVSGCETSGGRAAERFRNKVLGNFSSLVHADEAAEIFCPALWSSSLHTSV